MSKVLVTDEFKIAMIHGLFSAMDFFPITLEGIVCNIKDTEVENVICQPELAAIVKGQLQIPMVDISSESVNMRDYNFTVIAQYVGPTIPAGATTLPDGGSIQFWSVWIE